MAAPVPGLSTVETASLAALARAPLGLPSARAVAARAGISPSAASRAVKPLAKRGLVRHEPTLLAAGRARQVVMLHANRRHPHYSEVASVLRRVVPRRPARERTVPRRLAHLFWNTAPAQLEVPHGGPYIARRLLRTLDPDGLAWGARNLRAEDWLAAARARGLDPAAKALALNLAAETEEYETSPQQLRERPEIVAGIPVAGLKDLMAMKLKVLAERGELRDYYDVMQIDQHGGISVEDGIALYLERYGLDRASDALPHLIRALGYLADAEEDEQLPISKAELAAWWGRRQVELIRNLGP